MTEEELEVFHEENFVSEETKIDNEFGLNVTIRKFRSQDNKKNFTECILSKNKKNTNYKYQFWFRVFKKNYHDFWYRIFKHKNGNIYFVCSRDYQGGYSIFDVSNNKEYCYDPKNEKNEIKHFYWTGVTYDEDDNTLLVDGVFEGGSPCQIMVFDFSDPTQVPLSAPIRSYFNYDDDDIPEDLEYTTLFTTSFNKYQKLIKENLPFGTETTSEFNKVLDIITQQFVLEKILREEIISENIPKFTKIEEQLADFVIQIMNFAGKRNLRLSEAIVAKYNFYKERS